VVECLTEKFIVEGLFSKRRIQKIQNNFLLVEYVTENLLKKGPFLEIGILHLFIPLTVTTKAQSFLPITAE
jgi:hypothetical protein